MLAAYLTAPVRARHDDSVDRRTPPPRARGTVRAQAIAAGGGRIELHARDEAVERIVMSIDATTSSRAARRR